MKRTYTVTVLIGTVYEAEIEAENLDEALEMAEGFDPNAFRGDGRPAYPEWDELGMDRTFIIETDSHGCTAFGFGVNNVTA